METTIIVLCTFLLISIFLNFAQRVSDFKYINAEVNRSWSIKNAAVEDRRSAMVRLNAALKTLKGKDLTFRHFQQINADRSKALYPQCEAWREAEWMMALIGEVGEAANILKKRLRGGLTVPGLNHVGDELADCLCYISLLCSYLGLDMQDIMRCKFNQVTLRHEGAPVEFML